MLPTPEVLKNNILNLSPSSDKSQAINAFVKVIADAMNLVQGGPLGTPGIFTFGNSAMVDILMTQQPVSDSSWIPNFVNAWQAGILAGTIAPSTVTNPAWTASVVDTLTLPSPAATIITLSAATALLADGLQSVGPTSDAPMPLANAILNATLAFTFLCVGLAIAVPSPIPVPIPTPAE